MNYLLNQIKKNRAVLLFNKDLDKIKYAYMTLSIGHILGDVTLFNIIYNGVSTNEYIKFKATLYININNDIIKRICYGLDEETIVKIIHERFNKNYYEIIINRHYTSCKYLK